MAASPPVTTRTGGRSVAAKVVSDRLGHANISITLDTYTHVLPEQDAQAARAVANLILGEEASLPEVRPGASSEAGPTEVAKNSR